MKTQTHNNNELLYSVDAPQLETMLLAVNPASAYHVNGSVGGKNIRFMLDTGASVSLLSDQTWSLISDQTASLASWGGRSLVGVEGSAIQIEGVATLNLCFSGVMVKGEFIVAKSLNTEAILGLDFLEQNQCVINTKQKVLHISGRALPLTSGQGSPRSPVESNAVLCERLLLPPLSEIEVLAKLQAEVTASNHGSVCLVEALPRPTPIVVANALVTPLVNNEMTTVPIRLVNPTTEPVTLHKGSAVAHVAQLDSSAMIANTVDSDTEFQACTPSEIPTNHQEALWELVVQSGKALSADQQQQLYSLLLGFTDVFAFSSDQLGRTDKLAHTINTDGCHPIRQQARRLPPFQREQVHQLLQDMLSRDVIQPSTSPWASPVVLVKKKDGSIRFCIDYRKLNAITHKDAYPLPRIDDTLDTLSGSHWFSTLDLLSGYWQVEVAEGDRPKTAFTTHEGLFEFKVMPFGLCNAPATFQRLMDLILAGVQWSRCLVYLDDIIIIGRDFSEHLQNLGAVLQKLREAGLRLKPSKCALCRESVSYLGHVVSRDGVATDPDKTSRVSSWPIPKSVQEIQQFLGLASYYRRFVRDFATIARPLQRLTEQGRAFSWSLECDTAFATLKSRLTSAPILVYPDYSKPFLLDTDASQEGIGAVLSQEYDGQERVVAYASRTLSKAERKYSVTRKELLAVVTFVHHFRPYLLGRTFLLRTDHSSLAWLHNFKEPEGQLARWIERLQEYSFTIIHRQGRKHQNADALSRRPDHQQEVISPTNDHLTFSADHNDSIMAQGSEQLPVSMTAIRTTTSTDEMPLRDSQLNDEAIGSIVRARESNKKPDVDSLKGYPRETFQLAQLWDQLLVEDGVLYRKYEDCRGRGHCLQLVVPTPMRENVLEECHAGSMGGHLGEAKTLNRVKQKFFWPGYANSVREWCRTCCNCAARKSPTQKQRGALQNVRTGYPLEMVAADIMGPLPTSKQGNRYILVVSDYFTRWVEAYAIPNQEAITVAQKLIDNMFCRFSLPKQLHSDMGTQFESKVVKEMCRLLHIRKTHTTPYHPQGDGLVERLNRTIQNMLATVVDSQSSEWENYLPKVCFAYNTSEHTSTGFTPFFLMFGREASMPLDIIFGNPSNNSQSYSQYTLNLRKALEQAYKLARKNMGTSAYRQKELYDRKVHGEKFQVGQLVWLCNPVVPRGGSRKLHSPWVGPYKIVKCLADTVYRIQDTCRSRKRIVVHFDRLKPCHPDMRIQEHSRSITPPVPSEDVNTQTGKSVPPGTNLQLTECDDDWDDRQEQEGTVSQHPPDDDTNQHRRYPQRTGRRMPARYRDDSSDN